MVAFDNMTSIKKITFQNKIILELFPNVQKLLYSYRQIESCSFESGGILICYENTRSRNFTVANATRPQPSNVRSRLAVQLKSGHYMTMKKLDSPYGYIGTWHTHPTQFPTPSDVDLADWKKCIQINCNTTSALIFIIVGIEGFRVWLCDSTTGYIYEGIAL